MRIAVFCSASNMIDPDFNRAAREFARLMVRDGHVVVSGGTVKGTMGVLAE